MKQNKKLLKMTCAAGSGNETSEPASREAYIESILQVLKQKMIESQERKSQLPLFIRSTEDLMKIINDKKDKQRNRDINQANIAAFFQKRSEMAERTKKEQTDESSMEI